MHGIIPPVTDRTISVVPRRTVTPREGERGAQHGEPEDLGEPEVLDHGLLGGARAGGARPAPPDDPPNVTFSRNF